MSEVIIQLLEDRVDSPENLVNREIIDVTKPAVDPRTGEPPTRWPVHARLFLPIGPWGFTCQTTTWGLHSGHRVDQGELACDVRLRFKRPWDVLEILYALDIAIQKSNSRAWYNFALTVCDIALYPGRKFWAQRYQRTGKAPFMGAVMNCSADVDDIVKRAHEDLWPGMPVSLTVPGDYLSCDALEIVP